MQQAFTHRKSGGVKYSLNETDGTATVVAGSEKYSGSVVIPAEVTYGDRTYRVTAIGDNAFYYCSGLSDISIPASVVTIGDNAFIFCDGLSSVVLPDGLTGIGEAAFEGTGISTISIPATVKRIGLNAFLFCSGLTAIEVAGENAAYQSQDGVLFNKGMTRLIVCPAGKSGDYSVPASVEGIEEFAFYCCSGLKSVAFPEGLTSIGREAFNGYSGLTSITLPGSVTSIGFGAFQNCTGLVSFIFPDGVTNIELGMFNMCTGLVSVTLPASLECIENLAFVNCKSLKEVWMRAATPPTVGGSLVFVGVPTGTCSIFVPRGAAEAYDVSPWNGFTIEEYAPSFLLTDGEPFANDAVQEGVSITYVREFRNTEWQALYVPFALEYEDWADDFDVARINAMHQYDDDEDGEIDRSELEVVHLKEGGRVEPNTPYVVRAKEAGTYTFSLTEAALAKAEESVIDCRSVTTEYFFRGTYTGVSGADMLSGGYYALAGGELLQAASGAADLAPFRWYMQAVSRMTGENVTLPARIRLRVIDGNGTATGIDAPGLAPVASFSGIYTLDGRRVKAGTSLDGLPKGIYVVNGRKVVR